MSITGAAYKSLLREYDEKQLRAQAEFRARKERTHERLPRLKEIEDERAALYVRRTCAKLKGEAFDCRKRLEELSDERSLLLKENGLSEKDLEIRYECPLCRDTGFTEEGPCRCFTARITDILYDRSNIKEVLKEENFENFSFEYYSDEPAFENSPVTQKVLARRAYAAAKNFVSGFASSSDNLLISGGCGVGKTFLSNCIAKEIIEQGYFVIYLSAIRLFDILSAASFEKDPSSLELEKHIYECDLLIIDDLGTELTNSFTSAALFACINERLNSKSHTIISTNLSARQLRETYSERIFSRITNRYIMIKLLASDIRMKKRLEI